MSASGHPGGRGHAPPRRVPPSFERGLLTLAALLPGGILAPAILAFRSHLGVRHPATILGGLVAAGLTISLVVMAARSSREEARRRLGLSVLALVAALVTLGCLEVSVRLLDLDPGRSPSWRRAIGERPYAPETPERPTYAIRPGASWGFQYSSNERGYFDADNSVQFHANASGWRGQECRPQAAPGIRRVALLGDSFAFGEGVREEDTVAGRLPALLGTRTGCAVEVCNFAVPGYATVNEVALLESVAGRYAPDLVVVWYFLNDVETKGTMAFLGEGGGAILFASPRRVSALARFVGARLDGWIRGQALVREYGEAYRENDPRFTRMVDALRRIGAWGKDRGVPVALFVHPVLYRLDATYPFADLHAVTLERARAAGLEAFDLFQAFAGEDGPSLWVHPADQHPNEIGHAIAAAYAAERLASILGACDGVRSTNE